MQAKRREPVARAERNQPEPPRYGRYLIVTGLLIAVVLTAFAAFMRSPRFLITNIQVTGARSIPVEEIKSVAQSGISGTWFGFVPRSHMLLLSKRAWQDAILNEIPALTQVRISFVGHNATVTVVERDPTYVWCPDTASADGCAFLDASGMRYEEAPRYSRGVFLTFFGGILSDNDNRAHLLDQATFTRLLETVRALQGSGIVIDQVTIEEADDVAYGFQAATGSVIPAGAVVRATRTTAPAQVASQALLVFQEPGFVRSFQSDPGQLRVVDVRFPGTITYRFGEEVTDPAAPVTPAVQ